MTMPISPGRPPTTTKRRCAHTDRKVHALGYCKPCYDAAWRLGQDEGSAYRRRAGVSSRKRGLNISEGPESNRPVGKSAGSDNGSSDLMGVAS